MQLSNLHFLQVAVQDKFLILSGKFQFRHCWPVTRYFNNENFPSTMYGTIGYTQYEYYTIEHAFSELQRAISGHITLETESSGMNSLVNHHLNSL